MDSKSDMHICCFKKKSFLCDLFCLNFFGYVVLIGSAMGDCQVISLFPSMVSLSIFTRYTEFFSLTGLQIEEIVVGFLVFLWF